jgi:hypothetical protein
MADDQQEAFFDDEVDLSTLDLSQLDVNATAWECSNVLDGMVGYDLNDPAVAKMVLTIWEMLFGPQMPRMKRPCDGQ